LPEQEIGFAIPINLAVDLLPQLKSGKVVRGWVGIDIQDMTPELAQAFDLEENDAADRSISPQIAKHAEII